jgi:hypothetical protein
MPKDPEETKEIREVESYLMMSLKNYWLPSTRDMMNPERHQTISRGLLADTDGSKSRLESSQQRDS